MPKLTLLPRTPLLVLTLFFTVSTPQGAAATPSDAYGVGFGAEELEPQTPRAGPTLTRSPTQPPVIPRSGTQEPCRPTAPSARRSRSRAPTPITAPFTPSSAAPSSSTNHPGWPRAGTRFSPAPRRAEYRLLKAIDVAYPSIAGSF